MKLTPVRLCRLSIIVVIYVRLLDVKAIGVEKILALAAAPPRPAAAAQFAEIAREIVTCLRVHSRFRAESRNSTVAYILGANGARYASVEHRR